MREDLTEVVFILDRSGSMNGLEGDTIGGFNSMLAKQKQEDGEAYISTILFDNVQEVLHDRVPVKDVQPMNEEQYYVRGGTALLDAIGSAIRHIANIHKYAREEDVPAKTLFIITTDGMENASCNYNYDEIKRMIEKEKEKYGWEFLFLGANIDAIEVAGRFGISSNRAANYNCDSQGGQTQYEVLSNTMSFFRRAPRCRAAVDSVIEDLLEPIREDYNNRKQSRR